MQFEIPDDKLPAEVDPMSRTVFRKNKKQIELVSPPGFVDGWG